mmetsp:Transcript_123568/g.384675  ORF Transcript_123568/g.384675 Transcript_123568/m.384675 type:complete len:217 (+) Transcript_123568:50-700(+)
MPSEAIMLNRPFARMNHVGRALQCRSPIGAGAGRACARASLTDPSTAAVSPRRTALRRASTGSVPAFPATSFTTCFAASMSPRWIASKRVRTWLLAAPLPWPAPLLWPACPTTSLMALSAELMSPWSIASKRLPTCLAPAFAFTTASLTASSVPAWLPLALGAACPTTPLTAWSALPMSPLPTASKRSRARLAAAWLAGEVLSVAWAGDGGCTWSL